VTLVDEIALRKLGSVDYSVCLSEMRAFTARRDEATADELWLVEHPPVYTLGQGADPAFGPPPGSAIPVIQADRGGEITYHGPGQAVLYTLVDIVRRGIKVKRYVWLLEQAVIDLLGDRAQRKRGAPGVYVEGAKVAALGIRVRRGRTYHGVALNVDMDLAPFGSIAPCGYPGLAVTHTRNLGYLDGAQAMGERLAGKLIARLADA